MLQGKSSSHCYVKVEGMWIRINGKTVWQKKGEGISIRVVSSGTSLGGRFIEPSQMYSKLFQVHFSHRVLLQFLTKGKVTAIKMLLATQALHLMFRFCIFYLSIYLDFYFTCFKH